MVHAGYAKVYGVGAIEYVSGGNSSLTFNFDITLAGGQYQCLDIGPAFAIGSASTSYLDVCYYNTNSKNRWVADLEILLMRFDDYATSYYFGGNDVGANYGTTQIAQWDHDLYQQYTTDQVTFSGETLKVPAGWNQFCIFCACGRYKYCPDSQRMVGTARLRAFYTNSAPVAQSFDPNCPLAAFDGVVPTLSPAATPAPSTFSPTRKPVTPQPTRATSTPTKAPSAPPATLPECIDACTATDAPTYSPAWIPPTHYPTHTKPYSLAPDDEDV